VLPEAVERTAPLPRVPVAEFLKGPTTTGGEPRSQGLIAAGPPKGRSSRVRERVGQHGFNCPTRARISAAHHLKSKAPAGFEEGPASSFFPRIWTTTAGTNRAVRSPVLAA